MADTTARILIQATGSGQVAGELKKIEASLRSVGSLAGKAFGALGVGLGIGEIVSQFNELREGIDKIAKDSRKIGVSTEYLSGLEYAAKLSDIEVEDLVGSLAKLNKTIDQGRAGNKAAADTLRTIGIAAGDDTQTALGKIADKFATMPDGIRKTALSMELFGKSGARLIPMLNEGSSGIAKLMEEAKRLGIVISTEAALATERFNDSLTTLGQELKGVGISIAGPVITSLQDLIDQFNKGREAAGGFWSAVYRYGFKQTGDPGEVLKQLREERAKYEAVFKAPRRSTSDVDNARKQLEQIKKDIAYWEEQQRVLVERRYSEIFQAANETNKKIAASDREHEQQFLDGIEKQKKAYQSLADSLAKGAASAQAGAQKPVEESSVLDINNLRQKAQAELEKGTPEGRDAALEMIKQAQAVNDYLLKNQKITKGYYLTQADLLKKLAEEGDRLAGGGEQTIGFAFDEESALQAAADSQAFWSQNPAYQPVLPAPVLPQGSASIQSSAPSDAPKLLAYPGFGMAAGGLLRGPGTGTSDSIFARVSNREYIVNARQTARFLPLLEAINQDRLKVPRFATGGQVGSSLTATYHLNLNGKTLAATAPAGAAADFAAELRREVVRRGRR